MRKAAALHADPRMSFYGPRPRHRQPQGRRQKTAAARLITGRNSPGPSIQYTPGMRLSDHPSVDVNGVVQSLTDSEDEFQGSLDNPTSHGTPYLSPQYHVLNNRERGSYSTTSTPTGNPVEMITPTRPHPSSEQSRSDMVVLFQKQQELLQKVVTAQETMAKKQEDIEAKLHVLQNEVEKQESPKSTSSSSKRKRTVTLSLSVRVYVTFTVNCVNF